MSPLIVVLVIVCLAMIPGLVTVMTGRHLNKQGVEPAVAHQRAKRYGRLMSIPVYILMFGFILFLVLE